MDYDLATNQPIVIDNGTGILKAGFSGEQSPRCKFLNCIGVPKHPKVMMGALENDVFVGESLTAHRGLLKLKHPMEHGVIQDWDAMEYLWNHIYSKSQLNVNSDEHPVLLTETALNPIKHREKMAQIFFESFNVPALLISMQAMLSLYATGRTTGVVLDIGDGVTHCVPVYEGFALQHSIIRSDMGGRDITQFLKFLLRKEGYNFYTTSEFEMIRSMKEIACYVSPTVLKNDIPHFVDKLSYNLPDGTTIELGQCRVQAPEVLFKPENIGWECDSVQSCLSNSIKKSDMDLRSVLYSNIVLSGGSSLFRGFGDRLLYEVKKISPKDIKIRINAPSERIYATWIGGSILASLDAFKRIWISNQEYNEEGVRVIHKKMF